MAADLPRAIGPHPASLRGELAKLPAFFRRDFKTAISYRLVFFSDAAGLVFQAFLFYFVGLMINTDRLPRYGGEATGYLEFAVVGIALGAFITLGLARVATAIRTEQLQGTLESLLMTPTRTGTVQIGSTFYDLAYIPVRTTLFFAIVAVGFGLDLDLGGLLPAAVVILVFVPFVWGIGIASAGAVLTFKRGAGLFGLGAGALTITSGIYFPIQLFPGWLTTVAEFNPLTIAVDGMRQALLGGAGWGEMLGSIMVLVPISAGSLALGAFIFRLALDRERRRGTLGLY